MVKRLHVPYRGKFPGIFAVGFVPRILHSENFSMYSSVNMLYYATTEYLHYRNAYITSVLTITSSNRHFPVNYCMCLDKIEFDQ